MAACISIRRRIGLPPAEVRAVASVGDAPLGRKPSRTRSAALGPRFTPVLPYDAPAFGSVSGIVAADDGSVAWPNENRGVVRISAQEVAAILLGRFHRPRYELFGSLDGLSGASEQVTIPTAVRGTDGRLWSTTTNGAAWVDPRQLYRNELPPPVALQSVVADGRTLSPVGRLEIPGTTTHLQITYAGLSLSVPERVQFRYRLRGLDREWQSAGTRRTADYTKLPPGSYDFEVTAANDAGVWNEVGARVPIRIVPALVSGRVVDAVCASCNCHPCSPVSLACSTDSRGHASVCSRPVSRSENGLRASFMTLSCRASRG